ncbi:uncharacterized protein LOC141570553 [Rhinolophus sinicus]|uniref:uncharacterized protein LOC141570553 n=1 Tax=Rhinolophus sinicus TaxID=89399 RepID=UPI003D7B89E6
MLDREDTGLLTGRSEAPPSDPQPEEQPKALHPPAPPESAPSPAPSCWPPYPGPPVRRRSQLRTNLLPLQEMPGEFGPVSVQVPFSLQHLRQIKGDLGRFSDDPDKYIEAFQNLTQVFNLSWKDVMLLLNKTLTNSEKQAALQAAEKFGDDQFLTYHDEQTERATLEPFPTGKQAVPAADPQGDPDTAMGNWQRKHFPACILKGLRRTRTKPINYLKLSTIIQNLEENSSAFSERLREALIKCTPIGPDSLEVEILLKDKFITQAAPDICRKLQKLAIGPEGTLDQLLKVASTIFYNQDQEEAQDKERRIRKRSEVLAAALQTIAQQTIRGKSDCHHCGQSDHWRREYPRLLGPIPRPPQPSPICQGDHWESDCPQRPTPPRPASPSRIPARD